MRIVYAGTPDFAVPALQALIDGSHEVVAVYTQPDRPAGRGKKPRPSPVKQTALAAGLPVLQPQTLRDAEAQAALAALRPDLMVVAAYGLILPPEVLATPPHGCINIHASLLPRWRGAAPIQRAILAGDATTGVTLMQMAEGLDTGDMLHRLETPIGARETASALHDRLAQMGAQGLLTVIARIESGQLQAEPQDDSLATYAHKLDKAEAVIDWRQPAAQIDRQIRAFNAWPVAQTDSPLGVLRIWEALPDDEQAASASPGAVLAEDRQRGIRVQTGEGALWLTRLQLPGRKPVAVGDFLNSRSLAGAVLGRPGGG